LGTGLSNTGKTTLYIAILPALKTIKPNNIEAIIEVPH
jgi:hypothetical protein